MRTTKEIDSWNDYREYVKVAQIYGFERAEVWYKYKDVDVQYFYEPK